MTRPNYPRHLAVCIDEADLDARYRAARLRAFAPITPVRRSWWARIWGRL